MAEIAFNSTEKVYQVYQQLIAAGINDTQLDQGYHVIDYNQPGPNETLVGKADGKIEAPEVYEVALDLYEAAPENQTYHKIVESFAGTPLPWELDDHMDITVYDEKIRAKVLVAIQDLRKILEAQGYVAGTEEYDERMATGLFYFTYFPDDSSIIQIKKSVLLGQTLELKQVGLESFQTILFEKGGLGTSVVKNDAPIEATALETLRSKQGWCTEQSKVFYAVARLAGLHPFFVHAPGASVILTLSTSGETFPPGAENNGHVYIGFQFGQRRRYFDLSFLNSNAEYPNHYPWRLRHYLASDISNRGVDLASQNKFDDAESEYRRSIDFDSGDRIVYTNLGSLLEKQARFKEAEQVLQKAIELDSGYENAYVRLGNVYYSQGRFAESEQCYKKAIELNPRIAGVHYNLANVLKKQNKNAEAEIYYRKTIELDQKFEPAYRNLGIMLVDQGSFDKAIQVYNAWIEINLQDENFYCFRGTALMKKGDWGKAIADYAQTLKINPEFQLFAYLAGIFKPQWQIDEKSKLIASYFEKETGGFAIEKVQAFFITSYAAWEAGEYQLSLEAFSFLNNALSFKTTPSDSTKEFFGQMLGIMPKTMVEDKNIQLIIANLKEKIK